MTELNKLNLKSLDGTSENIVKIEKLFPNCITESKDENGNLKKSINFDVLKQLLSKDIAEGREYYEFTWPGKKAAILEANSPITKTLRPCKEESKDWQNTKNLYIEGDNLEALKILQESYLGKVKMIYIDPPYNTGNDFIYKDKFSQSKDEYSEFVGQRDEDGNRLFKGVNQKSNPRFHSDWCSMIYSRLLIARNMLSEEGVIFVSIDDNELSSLIKIMNEIYGENNFVGCISRATGTTTGQDANKMGSSLDYCLVYSKSDSFILNGLDLTEDDKRRFSEEDEKGKFSILQLRKTGNADRKEDRENMFYEIQAPDGSKVYPFGPTGYLSRWRVAKNTYEQLFNDGMIVWKCNKLKEKTENEGYVKSPWVPYVKYYMEGRKKQVSNLFQNIEGNKKASIVLKDLMEYKGIFDNPKPVEFIKILMTMADKNEGSVIMDFFSGSATTAHAVMQASAEKGENRQFIMVQIPEQCNENSDAYKAGYKNICEIGKERIRRAGEQIKKEHPDSEVDVGFRVFKVDSSNMKDVYYNPESLSQDLLLSLESNVKEDRSDLDLLFGCILDLGLTLDKEVKEETIGNTKVYIYNDDEKEGPDLIACFAEIITEDVITAIAKRNPLKAVFKDSSFENSPSKINLFELFKTYANISDDNELQSRVRVI